MSSPLTPQAFVTTWRNVELSEISAYQQHFLDLCRLIGHPSPVEMDPTGKSFTFQAYVDKVSGKKGFADAWKKGFFAWEYKGKHKDLDKAYQQLLQYREALENPPLLVVSDMNRIVVHTNFTNTVKRVIEISLEEIATPEGLAKIRAIFNEPERFRAEQTTEEVTERAAAEFARIAQMLAARGGEPHAAAHFLIRVLFCLFAEDINLLPPGLFTKLVATTRMQPKLFASGLGALFDAMAHGGIFGSDMIRHFNGGLFNDASVIELDVDMLDVLARVGALDWSSIEPAIFGTLFERSLDPAKRSQLGAHYTSREDILLIVEPVLMAPLRRRWSEVQSETMRLKEEMEAATSKRVKDNRFAEIGRVLRAFATEIASVQVLDPACGSGNFLYVALKQLLDLEKEVIVFAGNFGIPGFTPSCSPLQLHGIEVNAYAHELAQATIWIGYIQWLHENGFGVPAEPILSPLNSIINMDAILAYDEHGKPVEPEWPKADVIIGNPPFLGGKRLKSELGNNYVDTIFQLYNGRVPREADLVIYWFKRAWNYVSNGTTQRVGFLSTNSIRAGANREILQDIHQGGGIFLAWSDRPWILDGAAVRVSIVGFDSGIEKQHLLNGIEVEHINPDLTSAIDLTIAEQQHDTLNLAFMGDTKGGDFDIAEDAALTFVNAPINLNGCKNSDVVRPWANGLDITRRPRHMWIIDFGVDLPEVAAAQYELPFEYARKHVKPFRDKSNREAYRHKWWIHMEPRPAMRQALTGLSRFVATPRVAKHRLYVWLDAMTLPDSRLFVFAREDDYFFGIVHSRIHEIWSLNTCSWHGVGNDPTYNVTTCFETFPFPWPLSTEHIDDPRVQAIAEAARELVELRDRWLNPSDVDEKELKKRTLTNLYNARPTWLALAHEKLDRAVLDAYGWPHDIGDEEILARLLALNLERAGVKGNT